MYLHTSHTSNTLCTGGDLLHVLLYVVVVGLLVGLEGKLDERLTARLGATHELLEFILARVLNLLELLALHSHHLGGILHLSDALAQQ